MHNHLDNFKLTESIKDNSCLHAIKKNYFAVYMTHFFPIQFIQKPHSKENNEVFVTEVNFSSNYSILNGYLKFGTSVMN